jgi:hypothetical protein
MSTQDGSSGQAQNSSVCHAVSAAHATPNMNMSAGMVETKHGLIIALRSIINALVWARRRIAISIRTTALAA